MAFDIIALLCIIVLLIAVIRSDNKDHIAFVKKLNAETARTRRILAAKDAIDVQYRELCR